MVRKDNQAYDASSITVLEGLSAVRERPGMYIGDTGYFGVHHLLMEVVNNSVDEHLAGFCSEIEVELKPGGWVVVRDNGRGIPVGKHEAHSKKYGKDVSAIELVLGHLHAGGKFGNKAYKVSGGLHGVGVSCVNALSSDFITNVVRDGKEHSIQYNKGVLKQPLSVINSRTDKHCGTEVRFIPDATIFSVTNLDIDYIGVKLKEIAVLSKGLKIILRDERGDQKIDLEFFYPGGIVSHIQEIGTDALIDPIYISGEKTDDNSFMKIEMAFLWRKKDKEQVLSYVNNISTPMGGGHVSGFYAAATRCVNAFIKSEGLLKGKFSKVTVLGEDVREGLLAIISLYIDSPQFEGQTKQRLGNSDVGSYVQSLVGDKFAEFLNENRATALKIVERVLLAAQSREASKRAREMVQRKNPLDGARLPGKLVDCVAGADISEIYIVEGDSAGGSAKMGRYREFQAILPIRGKIINVEKATLDRVLQNEEIKSIVSALGAGIGESWDISKLRYNKVIIMTDADVDGSHIMSLLLTFFHRFMPELVERGHLYVAQPPLYKMVINRKTVFVHNEIELENKLLDIGLGKVSLKSDKGCIVSDEKLSDSEELIKLIFDTYNMIHSIERKGVSLSEFLDVYEKTGEYPKYLLRIENDRHVVSNVNEIIQVCEERSIEKTDRFFDFIEGKMTRLVAKGLSIISLFEQQILADLLFRLGTVGLGLEHFSKSDDPLFLYAFNNDEYKEIYSLSSLLRQIKDVARKGVELYRYKGLGEMNDSELGETTMKPSGRTLIRVMCDSEDEVVYIRALLMGEEVAPRRDFISAFALSIEDLDV